VEELGEVAANWHIDMPPGGADLVASDAEEDESEELVHGEFSLFHVMLSVLRPAVQPEYLVLSRAKKCYLRTRVLPILHNPAIFPPLQLDPLRRKPMKNLSLNTQVKRTLHLLHGNEKDSGIS